MSGAAPMVFPAAFQAVAQAHPDAIAVSDQDRRLTYREVDALSDLGAGNLRARSVGPDVVVGLLMERSVDAVVAVLSVLKAHGAFLPLDPAYPDLQLRRMVETARATLLVVADEQAAARLDPQVPTVLLADLVQAAAVRPGMVEPAVVEPAMVPPDQRPPAAVWRRDPPHPDHLAYVTHTSGSTHHPKAVAISHRSLAIAADGWLDTYRLRDQPLPHLQYAGFGFDVFIQDLARCLLSGGTLMICPPAVRLDPPALATFINAHGIAFAEFTPTLLTLLLDYCDLSGTRLPSLRMVAVGGEPWRVATYRRVALACPNAVVVNTYGLAESTIDNLAHVGAPPQDLPDDRLMPLGRPHPGTEIVVVDVATGRPVASGTGELYLAGSCLGEGYLGQPELTAERFVPHPTQPDRRCLRTRDLVHLDPDGIVHYLGRLDDQVKVRGVRVMLGEVEAALAAHPGVQQVVVRAAAGATGDELIAHVVATDPAPPAAELRELVRRSLVAEAVPTRIQFHPTLPVSANGKVDRARLASLAEQPVATATGQPGVAGAVAAAWQEVLGRDRVAPDDNFFALGGDSVAAAWVAMRVGVALGVHVPPYLLYDNPTLAGFVAHLSQSQPAPEVPPRTDRTTHPLSPAQRRLWLLSQLQPDHATYVVPTVLDLHGPLDRAALEAALASLVARHEPLRTVIDGSGAEPICRVLAPGPVPVAVERADNEDDARDRAARFLRRPMVLDEQPPIRACLIALGPQRHWLVLAIHHIATDGESTRIILAELGRLYDAALAGTPPDLAPLPAAYGDVAAWLAEQSIDKTRLDYWLDKLRGYADRPLALEGADPDRSSGGEGHRLTGWLGREVTAQVRAAARSGGTTVFVVLLAAFAELIRRWSGGTDICIGYPVNNREPAVTRELVGFFVDTRVVRVDLTDHLTLPALVRQVHHEVAEATAGGSVPFDQIVEALHADGHRGSIFRVWFNHLGTAETPPRMRGITASVLDAPVAPALFDLNVYVTESADDIRIDLVQDLARGVPAAADEVLEQYLGLVGMMLAEPEVPVRRHRPATRRGAALPAMDDPLAHPSPLALGRRLVRLARQRAGELALRGEPASYTYRQAREAVRQAARQVRRCGVRPGDVVAVWGHRSTSLVIAVYATLAAGGRVLMLDPGYPDGRSASYLATARPRCLILAGSDPQPALPTIAHAVPVPVLGIGGDGQARVLRAADPDPAATNLGSAGYVAFTSGTTGEPTAVTGTLKPVAHFLNWYTDEFHLGPADRFALLAGLSHDPLFRDLLAPAWCGGTLCVPSPETYLVPTSLLDWLIREEVTAAHLTPPLARLLLAAAGRSVRLPSLRLVCLAGDAVTATDVSRLSALAPRAVLLNGYGTTETPQLVSRQVLLPGRTPALGGGAPGSQLLVLDADGARCGIGETGQIVVRSRHLVERVLTSEATGLDADPVPGVRRFATGDLGRYQTDGSVVYVGRSDTTVKIRGFRASPEEIDRVLASDPQLTTSITVPQAGPDGMELVTYVVASGRAPVSPVRLRARLGAVLPPYLLPARIVQLERLPLTMNGKVNVAALPTAPVITPADPSHVPPESPMEHRLARIFSAVLGVEQVGVTDNFFDLGGDSLKMIRLHATLGREIGGGVSLLSLYQHPSVRSLARSLSHQESVVAAPRSRRPVTSDERSRRLHARQQVADGGERRP